MSSEFFVQCTALRCDKVAEACAITRPFSFRHTYFDSNTHATGATARHAENYVVIFANYTFFESCMTRKAGCGAEKRFTICEKFFIFLVQYSCSPVQALFGGKKRDAGKKIN